MANYVVIGGAGYIGSHLVYELCYLGHTVHVLDNFSTGWAENVHPQANLMYGDIRKVKEVEHFFEKITQPIQCVFHLAAWKDAGESMRLPEKFDENNITGTLNILHAMRKRRIKDIVFSSTAAVYGEPQCTPITETHPTNPSNYYGFTKLQIEQTLDWYRRIHGMNYVALRYFNAAGYSNNAFDDCVITAPEKNPANLLPIVMEVAAGKRDHVVVFGDNYDTHDGSGVRDYIHVTDLVEAHIKAAYFAATGMSLTVNLGTEVGYSVLDVIKKTEEITGKRVKIEINGRRPGDVDKVIASNRNAEHFLQWRPSFSSLENILKSMWSIYK